MEIYRNFLFEYSIIGILKSKFTRIYEIWCRILEIQDLSKNVRKTQDRTSLNWPLWPTVMFYLRRNYVLPNKEKRDVDIVFELMLRKVEINLIKIISFVIGYIEWIKGDRVEIFLQNDGLSPCWLTVGDFSEAFSFSSGSISFNSSSFPFL